MSQTARCPLELFCQRISALPSPLKSAEPVIFQSVEAEFNNTLPVPDGAIHEPDRALPIGIVLPKNIRLAIAVEIGSRNIFPIQRSTGQVHAAYMGRSVHQPDRALTGNTILPDNVQPAITVEIGRGRYVPLRGEEAKA